MYDVCSLLLVLQNDNADISTDSIFKSYCTFPSLMFSSMITFYICVTKFFQKHCWFDGGVVSLTKK